MNDYLSDIWYDIGRFFCRIYCRFWICNKKLRIKKNKENGSSHLPIVGLLYFLHLNSNDTAFWNNVRNRANHSVQFFDLSSELDSGKESEIRNSPMLNLCIYSYWIVLHLYSDVTYLMVENALCLNHWGNFDSFYFLRGCWSSYVTSVELLHLSKGQQKITIVRYNVPNETKGGVFDFFFYKTTSCRKTNSGRLILTFAFWNFICLKACTLMF